MVCPSLRLPLGSMFTQIAVFYCTFTSHNNNVILLSCIDAAVIAASTVINGAIVSIGITFHSALSLSDKSRVCASPPLVIVCSLSEARSRGQPDRLPAQTLTPYPHTTHTYYRVQPATHKLIHLNCNKHFCKQRQSE